MCVCVLWSVCVCACNLGALDEHQPSMRCPLKSDWVSEILRTPNHGAESSDGWTESSPLNCCLTRNIKNLQNVPSRPQDRPG